MTTIIKNSQLVLRIGLAFVLIYASIAIFLNPTAWVGFVPKWIGTFVPRETFLMVHGIGELLLGILVLFNRWPKIVYLLAALDMLSILIFYGIDDISFRDVGLFFLAAGLWLEEMKKNESSQPSA